VVESNQSFFIDFVIPSPDIRVPDLTAQAQGGGMRGIATFNLNR
jgi:hypothetical protein